MLYFLPSPDRGIALVSLWHPHNDTKPKKHLCCLYRTMIPLPSLAQKRQNVTMHFYFCSVGIGKCKIARWIFLWLVHRG